MFYFSPGKTLTALSTHNRHTRAERGKKEFSSMNDVFLFLLMTDRVGQVGLAGLHLLPRLLVHDLEESGRFIGKVIFHRRFLGVP